MWIGKAKAIARPDRDENGNWRLDVEIGCGNWMWIGKAKAIARPDRDENGNWRLDMDVEKGKRMWMWRKEKGKNWGKIIFLIL